MLLEIMFYTTIIVVCLCCTARSLIYVTSTFNAAMTLLLITSLAVAGAFGIHKKGQKLCEQSAKILPEKQ